MGLSLSLQVMMDCSANASNKIGGLPGLSWIWDMNPVAAALTVIAVDFGVICALMCLEGRPPWERRLALSFTLNDTLFLPLYAAMVVVVLRIAPTLHGFYTSKLWHYGVLALGAILSASTEVYAVVHGQYSIGQEVSPSKLWHTFIYCIMFYWIVGPLVPVVVVHKPRWAMCLSAVSSIGFLLMLYLDAISPWPWDAHLEGHYLPWEWHVRPR